MQFGKASLAFLCAPLCALVLGCGTLLGIEDRELDIQDLTADGYDGCEPENGECSGCTSDWHRCICEDWKKKTEAELRRDCAELAPESIRAEVEEDAEKAYQDYLDALDEDDDATDDDSADDDVTDDDDAVTDDDVTDDDNADDDVTDDDTTDDDAVTDDDVTDDDSVDDDALDDDITPMDDDEPVDELPIFNDSYCDFLGDPPPNHCQGCFCGECNVEVAICLGDRGCAEIMDCSLGADCDPGVATGPGSCYTAATCRAAIDGAGGLASESYEHFQDAMKCRKDAACPCGDVEPVGCPPDSACNNCISCWDDCVCTGGNQVSCTNLCGDPACNTSNACADCLDCVDYCLCSGGADIGFCMNQCYGANTDASCNPQDGCFCNTCYDTCICSGASDQVCSQDCEGTTFSECSTFSACDGCQTCEGTCSCGQQAAASVCLDQCSSPLGCDTSSGDCSTCGTCQTECECETGDPVGCMLTCQGVSCSDPGLSDCDRCSCDTCPSAYATCLEIPGCPEVMNCMSDTGCFNLDECAKAETCGAEMDFLGGPDNPYLGLIEALYDCRTSSACACFGPIAPNFVECEGGLVCDAFLPPPPDPIAQACCAGPSLDLCGLDPAPLFGSNATQLCLPLNQPGPLRAGCPNFITSDPPYHNAILDGCCRQNGTCGFFDNVTGLGCIDPTLFGQAAGAPCP